MFEPGTTVLVAVSGGPDSICLLHSLVRLRRLLKLSVVAAYIDHGLREGSGADGRYVAGQATRLGAGFTTRRVAGAPARRESVEAWARTVRYRALLDAREEVGAATVALGHTMDDQAETVLMALLRGGGLEALAGMRPASPPFTRPLLEVTRAEVEAFCRALHLRPRRDPMNEDPAYLRSAIRTRVLPDLERRAGRGVRATLARTASLLALDADFLDGLARDAAREVARAAGGGRLIDAARLSELPAAVAGRVVHLQLLACGVVPEAEHVQAVLGLSRGRPGRAADLPRGLLAKRDREYIRLVRSSPRSPA
jgi:tRNA(Ile)-lysidine synthase